LHQQADAAAPEGGTAAEGSAAPEAAKIAPDVPVAALALGVGEVLVGSAQAATPATSPARTFDTHAAASGTSIRVIAGDAGRASKSAQAKQASAPAARVAAVAEGSAVAGRALPARAPGAVSSPDVQKPTVVVAVVQTGSEAVEVAPQAPRRARPTIAAPADRRLTAGRPVARPMAPDAPVQMTRPVRHAAPASAPAAPPVVTEQESTPAPSVPSTRPPVSLDGGPVREKRDHPRVQRAFRTQRAVPASEPTSLPESHATADATKTQRQAAPDAASRPRLTVRPLAETIHGLVRIAARGDGATARITLSPPELGSVQIRLRVRGAAVIAELTAETMRGAQALGQAVAELRRSLEAQGLVVQGLDIRQTGPDAGGNPRQGEHSNDQSGHAAAAESEEDAELQLAIVPSAPAGEQVDVLA
jgi:flagellar hook-length control protein FliK